MSTTATNSAPSSFTTADRPTWELYLRCIHCGLCLQACPTYRVLGMESDSPRGRIYQVLQADAGRLTIAEPFITHMDRCLGCRACETACPSGVEYGRILERARAEIEQNFRRPWLERTLRRIFYHKVLVNFGTLSTLAKVLRFYQRSGLQKVLRATRILRLLGLEQVDALAPKIEDNFFFNELGTMFPAEGETRAHVAVLAGCVASVAFAELNRATIRVLNRNGVAVFVPRGQRCCGALHVHGGHREEARRLARHNINALLDNRFDAIVTNAAGCGSTMKEYGELLEHDPHYAERARRLAAKVKDVNEFLMELGLRAPRRKLNARVTYQDPCHLAHAQRIRSAPRELLKAIGAEVIEMPRADQCCGSAGTYNVAQNELAMKILAEKMDCVETTKADILATANVGCMLQLRAGVQQRGLKMQVRHVIELLDEVY